VKYYKLITVALVLFIAIPALAQKFGFVQSQVILAKYDEYVAVQKKLSELRNKYETEYQQMLQEYNQMADEIESQSLLLSPEKKEEKMRQVQQKALTIEQYKYEKFGPEGEFYQKQAEMAQPIIDKINDMIADIGANEGYDFIFDASSGALVHAKPEYDITQMVLESLNKGVSQK